MLPLVFIHDLPVQSLTKDGTLSYIGYLTRLTPFTLWDGGLYTFEDISRFFIESVPGVTLRLNLYA